MYGRLATALVLSCFVLAATAAAAQESVSYGSVSGRVTDATGAAVPDAEIALRHLDTNIRLTARSGADGRFRFPYLRIGPYELTVARDGFAPFTRTLAMSAGAAFELSVPLEVAPFESAVSVTASAEPPLLETARTQVAGTVAAAELGTLPMNGRHALDLALLVPGVSLTNVGGGTQTFAETSAVPGVGLSINSQRNFSNSFLVDGLSANDEAAGLSGISIGVGAIEQFQVVTSGGQAEFGGALGGFVSIVTRSGTNVLAGEVYHYQRDGRWNAANALSGVRLPMSQQQFGASLGGPLVPNRTFFFGNVERRQLDQTGLVTIDPAHASTINAHLDAFGYRGARVTTGPYDSPVHSTHATVKVDDQVSGRGHLSARYSLYDVRAGKSRGAGALNAPSASADLDNRDQMLAVGAVTALSPATVLEARGQIARGALAASPTDAAGPAVNIQGVAAFGRLATSPTGRVNEIVQAVVNLSHRAGGHALRAGVDVARHAVIIDFPRAAAGTYLFSSLTNFLAGHYSNQGFAQTFGDARVPQRNPNVGVYLQDEWKVRPALTLNLGLRYDLQALETIRRDRDNLSPRVGLAWRPFGSTRTIIRASAGLYYDRVPLRALANALLSAGNTTDPGRLRQWNISLSPGQPGAPSFPSVLSAVVPTSTLVNFTTMDPALETPSSRQLAVEIERAVGTGATVSVGYSHLTGRHLVAQINQNVPRCPVAGGNNGCRPNPAFANNNQYRGAGRSSYNGLHLAWVQRPAAWGSYRVSYALSSSMNNVGEAFFSAPFDSLDIDKDWAPSDDDQRQRLVVSATLRNPASRSSGWRQLVAGTYGTVTWRYASALPFNITSGATTLQGTPARPLLNGAFIPRNVGRRTPFSSVDLRVARAFSMGGRARLEALVEAFNLLNRANERSRNTIFGPGAYPTDPLPAFGQVTAVDEPRSAQLGVRLTF
jgi:hypothetical protein